MSLTETPPSNFIKDIINEHNRTGRFGRKVQTRFPPEPNGYLHIGHAKAFCIDFGIAEEYGGLCNLRFDDTNPSKEDVSYVDSIKEDIRWVGYEWDSREFYASDYFDKLYNYALELIKGGHAYVDDLSADEIREYRGTLTEPGKNSPCRDRSIEENLDLFERMKKGEFPDGLKTLRAKIDMASGNLNMRDPVTYRIMRAHHYRTGDTWCIYPMYDYAHCVSDSIEGITHSLCSLEFEDHRPLYDWYLDKLGIHHPQQIEFARLNLNYTVLSKRKLIQLAEGDLITNLDKTKIASLGGWDDPRMPTISGLRRRGYTPESVKAFAERVGVAKRDSVVDISLLEYVIREDLNKRAKRVMAVINPLKVVIENYPEGKSEMLKAINNPEDENAGEREIPFGREIYIEREDFMEVPPKKFFRLAPGREVRLKHAYFIRCEKAIKDDRGEIVELRCTYDPATKSGEAFDGRKVKSTLHWVSAPHAIEAEVRLFDRLFTKENPLEDEDFKASLNPDSLQIIKGCKVEPSLKTAKFGEYFQFLRQGYFCADSKDSSPDNLVFNRTVNLKDTWAKIQGKG